MLVHRLQEFIAVLSNEENGLFSFDKEALDLFIEKFAQVAPETLLTDEDFKWVQSVFAERWKSVANTCRNYTFTISDGNQAWISLARDLAVDLSTSFLKIIIPVLSNSCDPDNLVHIKKIKDPRHIYLDDNQTWHLVHALFDKIDANPNNLTLRSSNDNAVRVLSPTELFRIQRKTALEKAIFKNFTSLWDYIVMDVARLWPKKNRMDLHLISLLLDVIENSYNKANDDNFDITKEAAFVSFSEYIRTCNAADVLHFYATTIEYCGQQHYLFELLSSALMPGARQQDYLCRLATWIYQADLNLPGKIQKSSKAVTWFDLNRLSELVLHIPVKTQTSFRQKLEKAETDIQKNQYIDQRAFNRLVRLLSTPWQDIIEPADKLSEIAIMEYRSFWRFVIYRFAPAWQHRGKKQSILLADLRDFIDGYYRDSRRKEQINSSLALINNLNQAAIEDANYFYSMLVDMHGRKQYLLEILLDCMLSPDILPTVLPALAQWLYKMDPSLVVDAPELDALYQSLQGGRHFSLAALQLSVSKLSAKADSVIAMQLQDLQKQIAATTSGITVDLVERLRQLYKLRWNEIKDKAEDYNRLEGGTNTAWIVLAQSLAGAGLILPNYYRFLIPTLDSDVDIIFRRPFTTYSLTDCIVSEQGDVLIVLPHCVQNYETSGVFYNYHSSGAFTPAERRRILSSKPEYRNVCLHSEEPQVNPGLSRMTVHMLTELVNDSIYANGLLVGADLNAREQELAEWAYRQFWAYLQNLPEKERQDFYQYRIRLDKRERSCFQILRLILDDHECAATYGKYWIQLILNYKADSVFAFSEEVDRLAYVKTLRRQIDIKTYREPRQSCQAEAGGRLLTLMVSLLSHSFSSTYGYGTGHAISLLHHHNNVTATGLDLYKYLLPFIEKGQWTDTFELYRGLLRDKITPALDKKTISRSADTWQWLQSIANGNMFKLREKTCFDPEILLTVLSPLLAEDSHLQLIMRSFMQYIIPVFEHNKNPLLQWVDINLEFGKCLRSMGADYKALILTELRKATAPVSPSAVQEAIKRYHMLQSPIHSGNAFFKMPRSDNSIPQHVLLTESCLSSSHSAGDLFGYLACEQASSSVPPLLL